MKVLVLMLKSVNYKMSRSQSFRGSLSLMIPITTLCVANSEQFCEKILFFANHGHLQVLKVRDLKLLCPSQLRDIKDRIIKVRI
jgi:hypothetical protein